MPAKKTSSKSTASKSAAAAASPATTTKATKAASSACQEVVVSLLSHLASLPRLPLLHQLLPPAPAPGRCSRTIVTESSTVSTTPKSHLKLALSLSLSPC